MAGQEREPAVTCAPRFFRIIASIYELHAEVSEIALDERACRRLADELRFLRETLRETVTSEVYAELIRLDTAAAPGVTRNELRISCSELLGWLIALLPEAERAASRSQMGPGERGERDAPRREP